MRIFIVVSFFLLFISSCSYLGSNEISDREFKMTIGSYQIDVSKTELSASESEAYGNLVITFNNDSTFYLSRDVPFIYDSIGIWKPTEGRLEDWNWIYYRKNPNISTQFSKVWTEDSIFYLNSTTPKEGERAIPMIYFKKIKQLKSEALQ